MKEFPPLAESETKTLVAFTVSASAIEPEAIVKFTAGEVSAIVVVLKVREAARAVATGIMLMAVTLAARKMRTRVEGNGMKMVMAVYLYRATWCR